MENTKDGFQNSKIYAIESTKSDFHTKFSKEPIEKFIQKDFKIKYW